MFQPFVAMKLSTDNIAFDPSISGADMESHGLPHPERRTATDRDSSFQSFIILSNVQ